MRVEVVAMDAIAKPVTARARGERLEARLTPAQKSLIEHAAALQGRSLTDFVLASVQEAALKAIDDHQRIALSVRDGRAFVEALINPPPAPAAFADSLEHVGT